MPDDAFVEDVLTSTASPPGLSRAEAAKRIEEEGANVLVPERHGEALREAVSTLADPMALMLALAGTVYLLLGERRDAAILFAALVPVLGVDVVLEARSRRALRALSAAIAPRARLVRDGERVEVPASVVARGDVLLLEAGDVVAADAVVVRAANLALDESHLTGESEPVDKRPAKDPGAAPAPPADDGNVAVLAGSVVLAGTGAARVVATGARTKFAAVARLVAQAEEPPTPLQRRVARTFRALAIGAVAVAVGIFALSIARGQGTRTAFLAAVTLTMASIPEEFPLVFTIFLSVGAWHLGRKGVLVRRLAAVETLGSTTVLCVDKTGTLTAGHFALDDHVSLAPGDGGATVSDEALLESAVLACETIPVDPLELAIDEHAREHGFDARDVRATWTMAWDYDFDPVGKHMSHIRRSATGARLDAKGALDGILEHCDIDPKARAEALAKEAEYAAKGARVLAVASRRADDFTGDRTLDERGLTLLGLLAFRDPLRPEVPEAIVRCREAGIRLKILTGDHALTAAAIAQAAGIPLPAGSMLTGPEIDACSPEELARRVDAASVIARVRPEQKHAIVAALQRAGQVVAMTGDGINDAPALRQADIGISMGARATEVARAAADLVLLEDRFTALVDTVREGRSVYANLQRAFLYLVAYKIPVIALALLVELLGLPLLLLPVHLVWLELIVHPVSAFAFNAEPVGEGLMRRPPRPPGAPLVSRSDAFRSVAAGLALTAAVLGAWAFTLPQGAPVARALSLATLIFGSVGLVLAERRHGPGARGRGLLPHSPLVAGVLAAVVASVALFIAIPPLARTLALAPLAPLQWLVAVALATAAVGWHVVIPGRREARATMAG